MNAADAAAFPRAPSLATTAFAPVPAVGGTCNAAAMLPLASAYKGHGSPAKVIVTGLLGTHPAPVMVTVAALEVLPVRSCTV